MYNFGHLVPDNCILVWRPRLQNFVNVYTNSRNRNDSIYTKLPDLFFLLQIGKITDIFPK